MKKLSIMICVVAIMAVAYGNAMAAWSFDISDDNDDATYELKFLTDQGPVAVNSFSLGFGFDTSELALTGVSYNPTADFGFLQVGSVDTSVSGEIVDISALSFGGTLADGALIASFSFDLTPPLPGDGNDFFFMNWGSTANGNFGVNLAATSTDPAQNLLFADLGNNLTYGNNVDKVPIPSTLLILGSGLVGLVGIGRKKRSE